MVRKVSKDIGDQISSIFSECERVLLRALLFVVFVYELGRFARWLLR